MIVIYYKHAERRMEERGISRTIVEAVLGNPDTEETQSNHIRNPMLSNMSVSLCRPK